MIGDYEYGDSSDAYEGSDNNHYNVDDYWQRRKINRLEEE